MWSSATSAVTHRQWGRLDRPHTMTTQTWTQLSVMRWPSNKCHSRKCWTYSRRLSKPASNHSLRQTTSASTRWCGSMRERSRTFARACTLRDRVRRDEDDHPQPERPTVQHHQRCRTGNLRTTRNGRRYRLRRKSDEEKQPADRRGSGNRRRKLG